MRYVLDLGCGRGISSAAELEIAAREWMSAGPTDFRMVGIDINLEVLRKGKRSSPELEFACARGERLPFQSDAFDLVISVVAMSYMDIPLTLREVHRVLKPGGQLRIKVHPLSFTWSELTRELGTGPLWQRARNLAYRVYVIGNGITLHLFGFNFRFPFARRRCESFQTRHSIRRAFRAAGFDKINTSCWVTKIVGHHAGNCRAVAFKMDCDWTKR
jgi:ubiquinone/menaquinone biosynthesis C-methylase UbiE